MPVPGKEESGVLSPQKQRHPSSNFPRVIPIKKRKFPIIPPSPPSPEEKPTSSKDNKLNEKQESKSPAQGQSVSAAKEVDPPVKPDASKTLDLVFKKEHVADTSVDLAQANVDSSPSKPRDVNPSTIFDPIHEPSVKQNLLLNEKTAAPVVLKSKVADHIMNVKREIVGEKAEGSSQSKLSTGPRTVESSLVTKELLVVPALEHQISEGIGRIPVKSDFPLLSMSLSQEKIVSHDNDDSTTTSHGSSGVSANRLNWDLNTTMDIWDGSAVNDAFTHRNDEIGRFNKIDNMSSSSAAVLNKGKQVLDEHSPNSSITSVQNSPHKPDDILGLSLAMPYRELNLSGKQSSLPDYMYSHRLGQSLKLGQLRLSNVNLPSDSRTKVKPEPIDEKLKRDCSSIMKLSQFGSVKRECVENPNPESVSVSTIGSKNITLDPKSVTHELVPLVNEEVLNSEDYIPQSAGKVIKQQESSASSSILPTPTPHNLFLTRSSSCLPVSEDLSNESEGSIHRKELLHGKQLRICKAENMNDQDSGKCEQTPVDENPLQMNNEEKINISAEIEDSFGSDCGSGRIHDLATGEDVRENLSEGYEDGEVRETVQEDAVVEEKKAKNAELVDSDSGNVQAIVFPNTEAADFDGKSTLTENHDGSGKDQIKERSDVSFDELKSQNNSPQSISPLSPPNLSGGKDVKEDYEKESPTRAANESHGIGNVLGGESSDKVDKETCISKHDPTLSNKSRIIHLPRASALTTSPGKSKSIPSRLLTSQSGKERYSDLEGEIQIHPTRGNRDEFHNADPNKFVKDRFHDQPFRKARPNFMQEKRRVSDRFGPLQNNEWDSNHDYAPEAYNYRFNRRKNPSSNANVELDCNRYTSNTRRKGMNDDSPLIRRPTLRRVSPTDRGEDGSDFVGFRHSDKYLRHCSDDAVDHTLSRDSRPQTVYDELDNPIRGNRNFSTMQRKFNPRIRSKSPIRARSRSPGPWASTRRRSPDGLPELSGHNRSPVLYRRMRTPENDSYRDEIITRRRVSPTYIARQINESRELDHIHPRPVNSTRRSPPPARVFSRIPRRVDGDEYVNGPTNSNKFQDSNKFQEGSGEERKFGVKRGFVRSYRPNYSGDSGNYRVHMNDGPSRPYKFCPDSDTEFVEKREREFDGHMKQHQSQVVSRRISRNIDESQDGNQKPGGRVWRGDDEFNDFSGGKRRRF